VQQASAGDLRRIDELDRHHAGMRPGVRFDGIVRGNAAHASGAAAPFVGDVGLVMGYPRGFNN
jgi:hypothetical protein